MQKLFPIAAALFCGPALALAADPVRGQQVFRACVACHNDKPDDLGPSLIGVVGRKAGSLEDYRFSGPMVRAGFVWDEDSLKAFLKDPQGAVKGTRMPFDGLAENDDIDDVVAYLASRKR